MKEDTIRCNVSYTTSATSDAAGFLARMISTSIVYNTPDWVNLANSYKECRILGVSCRYEPLYSVPFSGGPTFALGASCVTHEVGAIAPTSLSETYDKFKSRVWNLMRPLTMEWRMSDTGEANFTNTVAAPDGGGFVYFASGLSPSTIYGRFYVTALVEFRFRN